MSKFDTESDALRALDIISESATGKALRKKPLLDKAQARNISKARAEEYYEQRTAVQQRKTVTKPKKFSTVWARNVQDQVQMDLWDIGNNKVRSQERNYGAMNGKRVRFALLVVEVKSRKVFGRLLTGKDAENDIVPALRSIFNEMKREGRHGDPKSINGDGDFAARDIEAFFESRGIDDDDIRISHPGQRNKNVLVERFIRTLRTKLGDLDDVEFGDDFPETFDDILEEYNESRHRTTGAEPDKVFNSTEDSRQGQPTIRRATSLREKFSRRTGIKGKRVQQVINPLNRDGTGKAGWQIGDFVRPRTGPDQKAKFGGGNKTDDPNYERDVYMVVERGLGSTERGSRQTFYIRKLVAGGTLGDYYRRRNTSTGVEHTRPVPVRGWELVRVTRDNRELHNWLEARERRDNGEDPRPEVVPRRPQVALGRYNLRNRQVNIERN